MALARGVQSGAEIARGRNEDENQKSRNYMEMMFRSQENQRQAAMAPLQQAVESNRIKAQSVDIANSLQAQQEQLQAKESFGGLARIMSEGRASGQLGNPEFEAHLWDYAGDHPELRKQPYFKDAMGDVKYAQSAKAAAAKQADYIQMRKDLGKSSDESKLAIAKTRQAAFHGVADDDLEMRRKTLGKQIAELRMTRNSDQANGKPQSKIDEADARIKDLSDALGAVADEKTRRVQERSSGSSGGAFGGSLWNEYNNDYRSAGDVLDDAGPVSDDTNNPAAGDPSAQSFFP